MAFYIGFYAYAIIGHTQADQLLPQLLMEQFGTFPIQCRHIEHGSEKIFFDKMTAVRTYICIDGAFMGRSTPATAFDGAI